MTECVFECLNVVYTRADLMNLFISSVYCLNCGCVCTCSYLTDCFSIKIWGTV